MQKRGNHLLPKRAVCGRWYVGLQCWLMCNSSRCWREEVQPIVVIVLEREGATKQAKATQLQCVENEHSAVDCLSDLLWPTPSLFL